MVGKIVINALLLLSGAYFIYSSFYLKKGFLEKTMALPDQTKVPSKVNLDRFVKRMFPITIITGIFGVLTGVANLVDDITGLLRGVPYYLVLVYLIMIITYGYCSTHARNQFLIIDSK